MSLIPHNIQYLFRKVLKSKSSARDVADGLAIGLVVAFLPLPALQMSTALFFTWIFRKNHWVAMLATWVTNPLTFIPVNLLSYWIGLFFYPKGASYEEVKRVFTINFDYHRMFHLGVDIFVPLVIGNIVMGVVMAALCRQLCLWYYDRFKQRILKNWRARHQHEAPFFIDDEDDFV